MGRGRPSARRPTTKSLILVGRLSLVLRYSKNMPLNVYYDEFQPSWEEEGLFARDVNGQLIRVVEASEQDYFRQVTVTIDGQSIRVPRAVPTTDAQGNIVYLDAAGRTKPRRTTIYDAALALCLAHLGHPATPPV